MAESSPLSGVNVVLVMAYGSLVCELNCSFAWYLAGTRLYDSFCRCWFRLQVFVLLFIFVKRQIMRFAMRSRRGPHAPIGHNAPKVKHISASSTIVTSSVVRLNASEIAAAAIGASVHAVCPGSEGGDRFQVVQGPGDPIRTSSLIRRRR